MGKQYSGMNMTGRTAPIPGGRLWMDDRTSPGFTADFLSAVSTAVDRTTETGIWFSGSEIDRIPPDSGAYLLALRLNKPVNLPVFRLAEQAIAPGCYLYAGSARGGGGIRARVARHFRENKTIHWHIDHLTVAAAQIAALPVPFTDECDLVQRLIRSGGFKAALRGFGNSDCRRCESHLLARQSKT